MYVCMYVFCTCCVCMCMRVCDCVCACVCFVLRCIARTHGYMGAVGCEYNYTQSNTNFTEAQSSHYRYMCKEVVTSRGQSIADASVHRTQKQVETLTPDHNNWCHKTGIFRSLWPGSHAVYSVRGLDTGLEP